MTSDTKPMDPNVEPEGYKPPTSAEELLERYAKGERYFRYSILDGSRLKGAFLDGVNLGRSHIEEADVSDASLVGADLWRVEFRETHLANSDLSNASLQGANLWLTNLSGTRIEGANFSGGNLRDTNFSGCIGTPSDRRMCVIDRHTYLASAWTPSVVEEWKDAGAEIIDLEMFPDDAREALREELPGLTLYFNARLTPFHRFLVDGVIFGTLGKDTDCRVAQYEERGKTAIIRLEGKNPENIEAVAEVLCQRIWEQKELAADGERQAMIRQMGIVLPMTQVADSLSALVSFVEKMELWLSDKDITEYLEDVAQMYRESKDKALATPDEVKAFKAGVKLVKKWVTGEAGKLVADVVKGALEGVEKGKEDE